MMEETPYDYDVVVLGGGSGGLSCAKEAANHGLRACVCDFVKPTPTGTRWGLGGTCVNVGCIPKKLMHQSALLGEAIEDARKFGWKVDGEGRPPHNWADMVCGVQDHIGSLNWGYRVQLREQKVAYENAFATFEDPHTIVATKKNGKSKTITSRSFVLAMGGRPRYPDIPGARDFGITSDDLFSLEKSPGRTLLVGASYVSLECAGFLASFGIDVTVMVRSIFLRGFDQECANRIGEFMEKYKGVKFIRGAVPTCLTRDGGVSGEAGSGSGPVKVAYRFDDDMTGEDTFNTVIFAIGRDPCTAEMGLEDKAGVSLHEQSGKIVSEHEETSCPHIYALGDILHNRPELTPVAIHAGKTLARRIAGVSSLTTDYANISTTIFTPLEYGCVGLSEEDALECLGDDLEIYRSNFQPLEWTLPHHDENVCYAKVLCDRTCNERIVGMHYLGPNAGEVIQGFGAALKMGMTKNQLDNVVGIHPTNAEIFTTLEVTRRSGKSIERSGC